MVKSKVMKELSEPDKCKIVTGRIRKTKKNTEVLQMRKVKVKLHSPPKEQLENLISATPFSKKSMITSTPFNAESNKKNGKRLPTRLPLSPIFSNSCVVQSSKVKQSDSEIAKENLPNCEVRVSRAFHDNVDPAIRTGTKKKSVGVRRITPALENAAPIVGKHNNETRTSRLRLPKCRSPIETLSSGSEDSEGTQRHSINHNNQSFRSCTFSDSSCSPDKRTDHRKVTDKASLNSGDQNTLVKRLQSDWSSSSIGEKTVLANSRKTNKTGKIIELHNTGQQVRQNKCSKLRVRVRDNILDIKSASSDVNPKRRKSGPDNTLVNQLKSDWTDKTSQKLPDLRTPKDNQTQKKKFSKRRLTPLIEMSVEERTIQSETLTATPRIALGTKKNSSNNEEEYSSSAEFQSDDEMNNHSRSKRAPTWRELLNKSNESPVVKAKSPEVRLQRLRTPSSKSDGETSQSPENKEKNSKQKEKHDRSVGGDKVVPDDRKKKEVDQVAETSKNTPLQETHASRSKRRGNTSPSPEKKEKYLKQKETHDRSGGDDQIVRVDKENRENSQKRKKKKVDPETTKDVPLQENHARRSKRLSSKNDRKNTPSPEIQEKKPQHKAKHDRSDDKVIPVDKETKGNSQTRQKKMTVVSSDVPLQENLARKSKELSFKSVRDPVLSLEKKAQNSQQKEKQDTGLSNNGQVELSIEDKVSSDNEENKGKKQNEKKKDIDVGKTSEDTPKMEVEKQMQNSVENIDDGEKTIAPSSSQQNHSHKSNPSPLHDEIEKNIIDLTCPVKFFHSRLETTVSTPKANENLKRRRSSKRKKQDSVFEFLSQSSSDSNHPVDDVIQKMIKTGKVVVAKHKKGTGKMALPRNRVQRKKITKTDKISAKTLKPLPEKLPLQEQLQDGYDDDLHFDNGLHFNDNGDDDDNNDKDSVRDQRGFSNLARSAMMKQAGRIQKPLQRKPITDKKKLLAMAMQYVSQSTPLRTTPQASTNMSTPQFSPMPGNKSPWRVDDDKLPNAFYLGRNSDNLPSFSSDYIPMTPCKNKSKSLSSFSSNDSNGENTAPPGAKTITNVASLQALANTRKALNYRSPLKSINILEVVNLPPLALHSYGKFPTAKSASKNSSKENAPNSPHKSHRNILENISNHSSNHSSRNVSNENAAENQLEITHNINSRRSDNLTNLFGFEELIDDDDTSINCTNITIDKTILPNKENLKERLQRLKQLRPNQPVITSNKSNMIKPVFDNVRPTQKTIKQMLCSTMIDNNQRNHHQVANHNFNESEDLSNLFKDLEPETTFDDSNPRRTYNRPFKRKRKMFSNYAMFIDSDASEDEDEANARPVKNYKAKPKKRQKENPDLNKFVNEFNEMCKEVSQYELVVE